MNLIIPLRFAVLSGLVLLSGCVSAPPPPDAAAAAARTPAQMLAAVRQAAQGTDERELDVQPLRENQVEDLRETAKAAFAQGDAAAAAAALDQALAIVADDPAMLQERAEAALALADFDQAERLSVRATELGSAVGPWCRRHWETVRQVRERRVEVAKAPLRRPNAASLAEQATQVAALSAATAQAKQRFDACTVPGINRM